MKFQTWRLILIIQVRVTWKATGKVVLQALYHNGDRMLLPPTTDGSSVFVSAVTL
jgi:hypothetical protein